LGSSCIYPKNANQPIKEEKLLTGKLEPTNEPYAIAKIAGIKMCESYNRQYNRDYDIDYRSIMPTNLYGPGDNFHPINSHVIPGLIYRFYKAKQNKLSSVTVWGTGKPKREFLYVDDMARASHHIMNMDKKLYSSYCSSRCSHVNVGSGTDIAIKELSEIIKKIVDYNGEIIFDKSKPDGNPRKFLDSELVNNMGFKSEISLNDGLKKTYEYFIKINGNS
jgi:GDP-L-fucose synthase